MFCSRDIIAIIQDFLEESGLIEEDERMDEHPEQDNKPQPPASLLLKDRNPSCYEIDRNR